MVRVYLAHTEEERKEDGTGRTLHEIQSAAVRRLLRAALERDYPQWAPGTAVEKDERGKPCLSGVKGLHISFSHSGGLVACAVSDKEVGVDVERWRTGPSPERIMKKLHPKEQEFWKGLSERERYKGFYDLWVRKESFLKATGEGLRLPLNSFCTAGRVAGESMGKAVEMVEHNYSQASYFIRQYELKNEEYSLAVCSREREFAEEPVWLSADQN